MNWKRGLIRFSAILSLLWLVVAGTAVVLASAEITQQSKKPSAAEIAECKKEPGAFACEVPYLVDVTIWRWPAWQLLVGIIFVPAIFFAVGAVGRWTVRGFKPSN